MLDWRKHIVSEPGVLYGKPVIINTRVSVNLILEKLAQGDTIDDLLNAYPNITIEDIQSCLLFASDTIKNEIVYQKAS